MRFKIRLFLSVFALSGFFISPVIIQAKAGPVSANVNSAFVPNPAQLMGVESTVEFLGMETVRNPTVIKALSASSAAVAALDYLLTNQNTDGSWGTSTTTRFITTAAVVEALLTSGVVGENLNQGQEWLSYYLADNNDYRAEQLIVAAQTDSSTSTAELLASNLDEVEGGFPVFRGYEPDPLTTAKALRALTASGYRDPGSSPTATISAALRYLVNTQRPDGGWSVVPGGMSQLPVTAEVIMALAPYGHQHLGETAISDALEPALAALINQQGTGGDWDAAILNTVLAYRAIKLAGRSPLDEAATVNYLESNQNPDGGFNNDIYVTAKVATALAAATSPGGLVVADIEPLTTLQTGAPTQLRIVLTNTGEAVVDRGALHIIADNWHLASFDFLTYGIVVNPGATLNINLTINSTRNYQGDVAFEAFVEGAGDVVHPDSRYQETLTYAPDPAGRPGLPMSYVAYKDVSSDGLAAITWRWPLKFDPQLKNIVALWRPQGASTWSAFNVAATTTVSGLTLGGLADDVVYEATLGTSNQAGQIYFFSGGGISVVKVHHDLGRYAVGSISGEVKSAAGLISGVEVEAISALMSEATNSGGQYWQYGLPWGTGYLRVSDFRYDGYFRRYAVTDSQLSGLAVYANPTSDAANPTVSGVSILGEDDNVMENYAVELIEYAVGDDLGHDDGTVASAAFYYYDPHDTDWHIIGVEEGLLTGVRTYAWDISGQLLGSGYKIRVVVRDFAGRESSPAEWGPFELMAGNASPAFAFHGLSSGTVTMADANYVIRWMDADPDDNATTTLFYDPDNDPDNGNHVLLAAIAEDDPVNEYVWDTSRLRSYPYYLRADSVDGVNDVVIAYSEAPVAVSHSGGGGIGTTGKPPADTDAPSDWRGPASWPFVPSGDADQLDDLPD